MPKRIYGWKQALPGHSAAEATADTSEITILDDVDPKVDMPPIVDQEDLGACTGNAAARLFRGDTIRDGKDFGPLSRLDIYYDERELEHDLGQGDTGAYGHDAFRAAQKYGIVPESFWPYDISTFESRPTIAANAAPAQRYWLKKPFKKVVPDINAVKAVLSNGQKIAVGFTVYESFETSSVAKHGMVPMPSPGEQILGGHEVVISGYEHDEPLYLWCDNSWGTGWGIAGRFLIPISYILNRAYANDWRTIQRPVGA